MTPTRQILLGDCRETLKQLPDNSVQCVVTSPPYFNLRSYGDDAREIGREKTPSEFIAGMVSVFREVKRVLREDGTLWVNMGDSYAASGRGGGGGSLQDGDVGTKITKENSRRKPIDGFKPKDLIGIPWMLAFALREDGWYLRSDIIWHKPNSMPESVTDRPTKAHEYIFLLTKSERYFYDHEAIKEPCTESTVARLSQDVEGQLGSLRANGGAKTNGPMKAVGKVDKQRGHSRRHAGFNDRWDQMERDERCSGMRNKRDVWTVSPAVFSDAHFATFPPDLIKPCVMAGTSEGGCCGECGKPMIRQVEIGEPDLEHQRACGGDLNGEYKGQSKKDYATSKAQDASATKARILAGMRDRKTVGWMKPCNCNTDVILPCTVLDPFAGSGTTGEVAGELGRNFIGCELYEKFLPMIERRTSQPGLML